VFTAMDRPRDKDQSVSGAVISVTLPVTNFSTTTGCSMTVVLQRYKEPPFLSNFLLSFLIQFVSMFAFFLVI